MPQVAEKTFEVIDKFVDAPRIIVDCDIRVAAGKAFDEIYKRLFRLADVADDRGTFAGRQIVL